MALGGVRMTDSNGNIGAESTSLAEKVCGLLFDVSGQEKIWTEGVGATLADKFKDTVVEFNNLDEVKAAGITAYTGEVDSSGVSQDFFMGIPYYHIEHFFQINGGSGRLFVAFADCKNDWNAIVNMQKEADGEISQFGVWTEQSLWRETDKSAETYAVDIVQDLQLVAKTLANEYFAPAHILLCANSAKIKKADGTDDKVVFSKIPSCVVDCRYVSVLLSQGIDTDVRAMQLALDSATPVGIVGAALGVLATSNVAESIGCVMNHEMQSYFPDIEFGFGDVTKTGDAYTNTTRYSSLTSTQLDHLDDLGYVFLCKYTGLPGKVYFSGDQSCSKDDYRTISRNRVINKSRRLVRTVLLPYVNSPIKVDPTTGALSAAQITVFTNKITDVLNAMVSAEEISGIGKVNIPASQNILKNDKLMISYTLVPVGTSKLIDVTEGFVLHA